METRANFILVGAFTVLGILGTLGFFVWLASVQIDRQYARYGVLFNNVAGLDPSADVLFNGVGVGRVGDIGIWTDDPTLVFVEIEIDASTPVNSGTIAQLQSLGVTGVAYIALSSGGGDAGPLEAFSNGVPIIAARRSTVQTLLDDVPGLLSETKVLVAQLQALISSENQAHVSSILGQLDTSAGKLNQALTDFSDITGTARAAVDQITIFTSDVDDISSAVKDTLGHVDTTFQTATDAFADMRGLTADLKTITADDLPVIMADIRAATQSARTAIEDVAENLTVGTEDIAPLVQQAKDVLTRSAVSLEELDETLNEAETAFAQATQLMRADLGPALDDLPKITEELRAMIARADSIVAEVQQTVATITPDLRSFSQTGLAQFGQLVQDTRSLVRSLTDLVRRIERDPTGFLLDDRVPEYRR